MTMVIGSLAARQDAHVVRIEIGRNGLRKTWGNPRNLLGALPFHCRFS
jgi:hypothetical protein